MTVALTAAEHQQVKRETQANRAAWWRQWRLGWRERPARRPSAGAAVRLGAVAPPLGRGLAALLLADVVPQRPSGNLVVVIAQGRRAPAPGGEPPEHHGAGHDQPEDRQR